MSTVLKSIPGEDEFYQPPAAPAAPATAGAALEPATGSIIPAKSASPESMVDRINGLYRLVNQHVRTSVETGLELGRTLCECRQSIGHGDWQRWIAANLAFSYKTARRYERLWSRRDDVVALIEKGHVSLLEPTSLTAVYRHLEIITSQEENEDQRKEEETISPASETLGEEGNKPAPIAQDGPVEADEVTRDVPSWEKENPPPSKSVTKKRRGRKSDHHNSAIEGEDAGKRERLEQEDEDDRYNKTAAFGNLFQFDPLDREVEAFAKEFLNRIDWEEVKDWAGPWFVGGPTDISAERLQRCAAVITKISELMT